MELTGKAKERFKMWLFRQLQTDEIMENILELEFFETFPDSMKWGVYVDFFDSIGFNVGINKYGLSDDFMWFVVKDDLVFREFSNTREEARTAAIEKANEIVNNR